MELQAASSGTYARYWSDRVCRRRSGSDSGRARPGQSRDRQIARARHRGDGPSQSVPHSGSLVHAYQRAWRSGQNGGRKSVRRWARARHGLTRRLRSASDPAIDLGSARLSEQRRVKGQTNGGVYQSGGDDVPPTNTPLGAPTQRTESRSGTALGRLFQLPDNPSPKVR